MSTHETLTDNPERSPLEQTWMNMGREVWLSGMRVHLDGAEEKTKEQKLYDASQWFISGFAIIAASALLMAALTRWVPLAAQDDFLGYRAAGYVMVIVFCIAVVLMFAFGIWFIFIGVRKVFEGWFKWFADGVIIAVAVLMVIGGILETATKMKDNADKIRAKITAEDRTVPSTSGGEVQQGD